MTTPRTSHTTDRELADRLGVSLWFVQKQCRDKNWPHLSVAGHRRFTAEHVAAIEQQLEVPADDPDTASAPATADERAAVAWGRSTRSSAQRARAARQRNTA